MRRPLVALTLAGVLGGLMSVSAPAKRVGANGGTLNVATTAAITSFDPSASSSTEVEYMANVYETLTFAAPPGKKPAIRPALATRWSHSKNGKVWTFFLRHGVHFHDGSLMTSRQVADSLNRTIKLGQGGAYIWAAVTKIVPSGTYAVKFYLKFPKSLDYVASAEYGAWIMGPDALNGTASYFAAGHDDGTGPYTISSYQPDRQVVLTAFPKYWGGWKGSHYSSVVSSIISESAVQQQMVLGGQADMAKAIPVQSLASIRSNPQLKVVSGPSHFYYGAYFNTRKKPLNNPLVRRALSYAIPYKSILQVGTGNLGKQMQGPLPYGLYPHDNSLPKYTTDLAQARKLLKQAGYAHGGFDLTLTFAAENPDEARWTPLIKESFAKLGVGVTIRSILFNQQWALAKGSPSKAQDMFILLNWPTYNDASPDLQVIYECSKVTVWNLSYYCNHTFDKTVEHAVKVAVTHPKIAHSLFHQAQMMLFHDAPVAFLYQAPTILVMNRSVKGPSINASYPFVTFYYPLHS